MSRKWYVIGAFALMLALAGGTHLLSKTKCFQLVGDVVCKVETERKVVALTFDDGPTPQGVNAILPVLEEHDVQATFFLIGHLMEQHPQEAAKILEAGHELGNHTYSHKQNMFRSQSFYRDEVLGTKELLDGYGSDTNLFRPPFGKRLIGLPMVVDEAGYISIMWDVADRSNTFPKPADYAAGIVNRAQPGSIILMHPMYRHNQTARKALPMVIEGLRDRGFEIVTVSQLLELNSDN